MHFLSAEIVDYFELGRPIGSMELPFLAKKINNRIDIRYQNCSKTSRLVAKSGFSGVLRLCKIAKHLFLNTF